MSGKKYKKCCLPRNEAARPRVVAEDPEEPFITELRPDLDEAVDRLLERLELGAGRAVEPEIKALLEKHPRHHMPHYAMGVYIAIVMKDPVGAIPFFETAVQIFPPFPEAHYNLGTSARMACEVPKAVEQLRRGRAKNSISLKQPCSRHRLFQIWTHIWRTQSSLTKRSNF
jgi:hypothetical protein